MPIRAEQGPGLGHPDNASGAPGKTHPTGKPTFSGSQETDDFIDKYANTQLEVTPGHQDPDVRPQLLGGDTAGTSGGDDATQEDPLIETGVR